VPDTSERTEQDPGSSSSWGVAAAAVVSAALFLVLTVPRMNWGPVTGTGQDAWYNVVRALRALYDHFDTSYFIHPALYYELLASLYGLHRLALWIGGSVGGGTGYLDYFLAHQVELLDLARCASAACGALAVAAAVWLGALLSSPSAGLLAGLIVASLPLLQALGTAIRVDTISLATMLGAAALIVRWYRAPRRGSFLLAGAGIGVATAANYPAALLLGLLGWLCVCRRHADASIVADDRRASVVQTAAVALAVFLVLNPYVVLDFPLFWRWFTFQANVALLRHPHADEPAVGYYLLVLRDQGVPAVAACVAAVLAVTAPSTATGALAVYAILQFVAFSLMRSQYDRFVLPAIALLCIVGSAWLCSALARIRPWAATTVVLLAAPLVLWSAAIGFGRELPGSENSRPDYRPEMFAWIESNVPASATLVMESDTMPLLQAIYDRGDRPSRFQAGLQEAFEKSHPGFVKNIVKSQFIAAVYNYDPKLLEPDGVFFLASSQNRDFIEYNHAVLPEPAAFYDVLDRRATVVHEGEGMHERLLLYATRSGLDARTAD
jgi:hypothetical protein